jgi:hypothetical protein
MKKYPVQIAIIWLVAWFIPSTGWLQERNEPFDIGTMQLKLLSDSGRFSLQITEGDTLSQLSIPPGWLIPKENEENGYVSSFNYDETLTAFRIGRGLTGIQISSYDIQKEGSAQAAAGRDVFIIYNAHENQLYPGIINLGITKDRVRSGGTFYATNNIFLLADINHDGFKDIGIIKEDLKFSPLNQSYIRYPPKWYIFKNNCWINQADSSGIFPLQEIIKLPLIGLSKSPVDFIKEEYLRKNICVLDYKNFGVQAMAHELLGFQWYQWNNHGDPDPNATYDIKVVVYNNIPPGKVKELYPIISALEQDFRYVEYSRAMQYFNRQIQQIDELGQTELRQENMSMFKNLRSTLIKTREEIVNKLNNSNFNSEKLPTNINIKKIVYRFEDSSVPPEYHRSYTITLTPEKTNIIVDSYGDIIAEKEYKIRKKQFINIVNSLTVNNIRKQPLGDNRGCTGGTGEILSYWDEKNEIFSASVYHCGGIDSGNLGGNIKAFADDINKLVPKLYKLL